MVCTVKAGRPLGEFKAGDEVRFEVRKPDAGLVVTGRQVVK